MSELLKPECFKHAFKTLLSFGLAIEEIKMSRACRENAGLASYKVLHLPFTTPNSDSNIFLRWTCIPK